MNYRIGCSGYYYPTWKDKFYPSELPPKEWLPYYSSVFNTVELNGTFYRMPKLAQLKKYAAETPEDFSFSVKMSKGITHLRKLKECKQLIQDFQDLVQEGLGNKLSYFLFQFPATFHFSAENLEKILQQIPNEERNVIEFRHASWWNDEVKAQMENAQLTFCNVDYPGLKTSFIHTTPSFYLRLHGNPELFKSFYEPAELEEFYSHFPAHCKNLNVYFNNTFFEAGYTNAAQMMDIINQQVPL